jgi:hypothetical protein
LKLELLDAGGVVRSCAASDTPVRPPDTETLTVVAAWQQPAQPPSAAAGMHRQALSAAAGRGGGGFGRGAGAAPAPDACSPAAGAPDAGATAGGRGGRGGRGGGGGGGGRAGTPVLAPGPYTVRLTVDGQTYTQPVTIKPDLRQ